MEVFMFTVLNQSRFNVASSNRNENLNIKVKTDLSNVNKYVHSEYSPLPSFLHQVFNVFCNIVFTLYSHYPTAEK